MVPVDVKHHESMEQSGLKRNECHLVTVSGETIAANAKVNKRAKRQYLLYIYIYILLFGNVAFSVKCFWNMCVWSYFLLTF